MVLASKSQGEGWDASGTARGQGGLAVGPAHSCSLGRGRRRTWASSEASTEAALRASAGGTACVLRMRPAHLFETRVRDPAPPSSPAGGENGALHPSRLSHKRLAPPSSLRADNGFVQTLFPTLSAAEKGSWGAGWEKGVRCSAQPDLAASPCALRGSSPGYGCRARCLKELEGMT